jgi:hypothetical protein
MANEITYYALVDDFSSRNKPGSVVRRIRHEGGQHDEAFTSSLTWERTLLLYSAERGNLDNTFYPITEEEAMQIVERIRQEATTS